MQISGAHGTCLFFQFIHAPFEHQLPSLPSQGCTVQEAAPACLEELLQYHSRDYLAALALWEKLPEARRDAFGLQDDCPPFQG